MECLHTYAFIYARKNKKKINKIRQLVLSLNIRDFG